MADVFLSICMPVYNCAAFLPQALGSILPQCDERIELVVYDGGSTDQTPELMQRFARPGLRYVRAPARGGIDADLARCVASASGRYCWLFSGDDVMRPGALARALHWLAQDDDVVLCRHTLCDIAMRVRSDHAVLHPADLALAVDLADAGQRRAWFACAATTEAFFSFLSGIIVRRATWDRGRMEPGFETSCWAHAARLLALAPAGLRVRHVPEIWLDQRGDNDSFAQAGTVNRYRIAIEGYQRIGDAFFGHESTEAFHMRRVLRREFSLEMFLGAKILCAREPQRESRALLDSLYNRLHSDRSLASTFQLWTYRLMPVWMASLLREAVRALRRVVRRDHHQVSSTR